MSGTKVNVAQPPKNFDLVEGLRRGARPTGVTADDIVSFLRRGADIARPEHLREGGELARTEQAAAARAAKAAKKDPEVEKIILETISDYPGETVKVITNRANDRLEQAGKARTVTDRMITYRKKHNRPA